MIGTIVPIFSYLLFLAAIYYTSRLYLLDNIVIDDNSNELLRYYYAYFNFIGFFVGKQALMFTFYCWAISGAVLTIYVLSVFNVLGEVCKLLALYILPPLITTWLIGEVLRATIGL